MLYNYSLSGQGSFVRDEPEYIQNGTSKTEVVFEFDADLIPWYVKDYKFNLVFPKTEELSENNVKDVLNYFFNSKEFAVVFNCFKAAFNNVSQATGGFPSPADQTRRIVLRFRINALDIERYVGRVDVFRINLGLSNIARIGDTQKITYSLVHELYHMISGFRHGEEKQTRLFFKWKKKLEEDIEENKESVKKWMSVLEQETGPDRIFKKWEVFADFFFQQSGGIYWNIIDDIGLNLIALELEDVNYAFNQLSEAQQQLKGYIEILAELADFADKIRNLDVAEDKKRFYMQYLALIEFIIAFQAMPFEILAFVYLDDVCHKKKEVYSVLKNAKADVIAADLVKEYESWISKYFEKDASAAFMKFWVYLKSIVKNMNIYLDPDNPDYTMKIHNIHSLKRSKEGYKLLNRLFKDLLDKVHASE
ncbi:hypothetical protein KY310_04840 [Candidatus Woesearchaeota archaeon]|nr:hypothetical protein [Candidatus Woesearchaeota archaeon]